MKTPRPHTTHHTTIPAEPGWMYCTPVLDIDGVRVIDINECPVIAWVIETRVADADGEMISRSAQAVVADRPILTRKTWYLKRPDGLYVSPGMASFETRDALIASRARIRDAETAERRQNAAMAQPAGGC